MPKFFPLAAVVCFLAAGLSAAAQQVQTLQHHVRPAVANHSATYVGPLAAETKLHLSIQLPLRNQDALAALLKTLYDPTSSSYRHFLTVQQFTDQFGPTEQDYKAVEAYARANGLQVDPAPANRMLVPVSGSVKQINAAFAVQMNLYKHPTENRTFFSPDREPSLRLGTAVTHISGMDNYSLPKPLSIRPQAGLQSQTAGTVTGSGPGGSYLGSDMRAAYYGGSVLDGTGQAVALFEIGGYDINDLNLTFSNAGQSYTVPVNNVLLDGATGGTNNEYGDGEQVLDIVQAIGMAPALSQVRVYIGTDTDEANILNTMAVENLARQISCSWSWIPADVTSNDAIFQEMAAQGQSFLTASGDHGAFDTAISPYVYPQEDPYVTVVGGTHLTTNGAGGAWSSEVVWNSFGDGSGGGISPDQMPLPSWQVGLANSQNGGSTSYRNSPDIAMEGDFDNYNCQGLVCQTTWAGTSFAAPRWAGFLALVNQQAAENGNAPTGIGFLNPQIYQIAQGANAAADLHDITSGNNLTDYQPVWYSAVAGYDLTTGWGSANGQSLIDDLAGPQVPGFWLGASQSTVSVNPGGSGTTSIRVVAAGGFTGSVNLAVTSTLPSGITAAFGTNPTTGSSVLTVSANSSVTTQTVPVTITGTSGTLTETLSLNVAVHSPSFSLSSLPMAVTLTPSGTATAAVTVKQLYNFTGNVSFSISGLPSGVTASFSPTSSGSGTTLTLTGDGTPLGGTTALTITGTSGSITATTTLSLTVQAPSFQLTAAGPVTIGQGGTVGDTIYVTPLYGFTGSVSLAASNLPAGMTASFSPNPATGYSYAYLTLTASASTPLGSSVITITGTSGALKATTTVTVNVVVPTFTLTTATAITMGQNSSVTGYVLVNPEFGFTGSVALSVSGLPSGVTALFSPNPISSSSNSGIYLASSAAAAPGVYPLTITGTSGTQKATSSLTLTVSAPSFQLSDYSSLQLGQGSSTTNYVSVNALYGFTGNVTLAVSGLPSGVTASFSPNPVSGNLSSVLTVQASSTAPVGQYTLTITGTSGGQTATTTTTLGIYTPTFFLTGGGSYSVGQGTSSTSYVSIVDQYGFNGQVNLSVSGLPAGVTASFSPNPTTSSSALTFQVGSSVPAGQYPMTLTGTSGTLTVTTPLTLFVYAPAFTVSNYYSPTIGQGSNSLSYIYISDEYGFSSPVTLSVSGLPTGVTAVFGTNPTTAYSDPLTLNVGSAVAPGTYNLTITGTGGGQTVSAPMTLTVVTPSFSLIGGGAVTLGQGSSGTEYIYPNDQGGFNSPVTFSISGLPTGVTATLSPNPTAGTTMLTLNASSSAPVGQTTATVTGTAAGQTATLQIPIDVVAPNFNLYWSTLNTSLNQGTSAASVVSISPQNGFSSPVTLTVSGLPSGVTGTFASNTTVGSDTLTLTAASNATPGASTITVTGTAGSVTASTTALLTVNAGSFTLSGAPSDVTVYAGNSGKSTVSIVPINSFAGNVALSVSGLPAGVTGSFSPATATSSSTLTLTASSTASPGPATLTINGTSGSLAASTTVALQIASDQAATSTTLSLAAAGSAVTSVSPGTLITATATASAGSTPLTVGQIYLCDATASYCDSIHQLATAQITSSGTATFRFIPGIGVRSYKAMFAGTDSYAASASSAAALTVNGTLATTTTLAQSGSAGNYALTATVAGSGDVAPTGNVSFIDTTTGNSTLATAPLTASSAAVTLKSQTTNLSFSPGTIVSADFNGDGIPDMAIPNPSGSSVAILLGKGDSTFTTGSALSIGATPLVIATGDFNRDGNVDLAVASSGNDRILIYLGNGDGTFTVSSALLPTAGNANALTVADFNGDGYLDIASLNGSTINVLLGNGDGTFTPSTSSQSAGSSPAAMTVADFDGDGIPDLAVANSTYSAGAVSILLGNGDGTFTAVPSLNSGAYSSAIVAGDFNQDGIPDLVVGSPNSAAAFYPGNGDGTFGAAVSLGAANTLNSFAVADVNRDGRPDLVATNTYYGTTVVLLGNGDGTFSTGATASPGFYGESSATVGDWNGDGIPDFAITSAYGDAVSIYSLQLAQTATATASSVSPTGPESHLVDAAYPGDTSYRASGSATVSLAGAAATPTVTVTPAAGRIGGSQALIVHVTIGDGSYAPVPTGSVTLTSGSFTSAAVALTSGAAAISVPAGSLAAGSNNLTVSYTPDTASSTLYNPATGTASVIVGSTTPTVGVTLSSPSIRFTDPLTVSVTVTDPQSSGIPTGSVTLSGPGYTSSAVTLNSTGAATVQVPAASLTAGTDTLTVNFTPDTASTGAYNAASATSSVTVGKVTPNLTWSTPAAITYGPALGSAQLNATASVPGVFTYTPAAGSVPSAGTQTLSVTFTPTDATDYSSTSATVAVNVSKAPLAVAANNVTRAFGAANPVFTGTVSGVVNADVLTETFSTSATAASPVGTYAIVPAITGTNAGNYQVTPTSGTLTISPAATTTSLALSNQNLTFTATVAPSSGSSPTGTVSFYAGTTLLGSGTVAGGTATYTASAFPSGNVSLSAHYSGDSNFASSTSAATPVLSMSLTSSALSLSTAGSASDALTLTVPAGYSGAVQLACTGLPQYASCSFQPASVSFTGGSSSSSVTLTLGTGGLASLHQPALPWSRSSSTRWAGLLSLPGLLALCSVRRRRIRVAARSISLLALLVLAGTHLTGCSGGSGNSGGSSGSSSTPTPAGTYTVQVTASGPSGLSQSSSITLTVQ